MFRLFALAPKEPALGLGFFCRLNAQHFFEERGCAAVFGKGDFFGGAFSDDFSALGACFGADVEDMVCFGDDIEVVLDDDNGAAFVDEAVEDMDELRDIVCVKADGRLLEHIESGFPLAGRADFLGSRCGSAGELGDELDALGFAAAECGAGLSELEVAESGFLQKGEWAVDFRVRAEEFDGLLDRHVHDIADGFSVVENLKRGWVVASSVAVLTRHVGWREEVHFQFDHALSEAGFAAAALVVEGEPACGVATHAGGGKCGENFADFVEDLHIGRRCGAGSFSDGRLVHFEHGTERFEAGNAFVEV